MERFERLGGQLRIAKVCSLEELPGDLVVNCCGLGGKELCQDEDLEPIRGQIVYIEQDQDLEDSIQRPESLIYTIPRRDVTVLGGTAQEGIGTNQSGKKIQSTYLENVSPFGPS